MKKSNLPSQLVVCLLYFVTTVAVAELATRLDGHNRTGFLKEQHDCEMWSLCTSHDSKRGCIVDCHYVHVIKTVPNNVPAETWFLDMSENEIARIGKRDFSKLKILEILDLSQNVIETIEPKTFRHQKPLTNLNLSDNKLEEVTKGVFFSLVNVKALNLSKNQLRELQDRDFKNNIKLETLDLSENKLTIIPASAFRHLYKLQLLYLSSNQIEEVADSTFRYFPNLKTLDLSQNQIKDIEVGTVSALKNLKELNLGGNHISYIHRNAFRNLSNLQKLDLPQNNLRTLPKTLLHSLIKLNHLDISGNQIQILLDGIFHNLSYLQNLDISHNQLVNLNKGTFRGLNQLEKLFLSQNTLKQLSHSLFLPLVGLLHLDLSQNAVTQLYEDSFIGLSKLQHLNLSQNTLRQLPQSLLQPLVDLIHLDLSQNGLTQLQDDAFIGLPKLRHLLLTGNRIMDLPSNVFTPLVNLTELYLDGNHIRKLHDNQFENLKGVTLLYISRNDLTELTEGATKHLNRLEKLYINENKISEIEKSTFRELLNLRDLNVSSNRILKFSKKLFWPLGTLLILDLSENQISKIWKDSFYNLSRLEQLRLNGNRLENIHRDTFKHLHSLSSISLDNNRLKTLRKGTLVNMPNLFHIFLLNNQLEHLEQGSIENVPRLDIIDLAFNWLPNRAVDRFFSNLSFEFLDLSHNNFSMVSKDLFHFKEGTITYFLSISNNRISSLPGDLFSLISLYGMLDMSDNQIRELPPHLFSSRGWPHGLETLLLHRNNISFIARNTFEGLYSLTSLCLFHNKIDVLADGAFSGTSVKYIYLFGNDLSRLSQSSIDNDNITEIHLYDNPYLTVHQSGVTKAESFTTLYLGCDDVREIQRTMIGVKCVTPNYVPSIEFADDVASSLHNEGFTCNKTDENLFPFKFTSECSPCPRGHFGSGNLQCSQCPAGGYYQDEIGTTTTVPGEIACKKCPKGMFVNHTGATSIAECKICPDGTNKSQYAGLRACACLDNFARYDRFGPCFLCVEDGYNCSGSDYVSINPGYFWSWNFSTANITKYKRFITNLQIETRFFTNAPSDTRYSMEIPQVFRCPRFNSCNNAPGALEVTCSKGYRGWLCSKCERGFFGVMESCFACPSYVYLVIEVAVGLAVVSAILFIAFKQHTRVQNIDGQLRSVSDMVISRTKIVLGFYQVIGEFLISFHEINWIAKVYIVGELFSFLEINILRLFVRPRCLIKNLAINPKTGFIISVAFLCISILVPFAVFKLKVAYFKYKHPSMKRSEIILLYYNNLKTKIAGCVFVLLFLTYPSICTSIFKLFPSACQSFCFDVKKAHCIQLLRSDFDMSCTKLSFYQTTAYIATVGYVIGFPALLFFFLRKYIHANVSFTRRSRYATLLDTEQEGTKENLIFNEHKSLIWISFFCENYRPQYWYWEIIELTRKMTQTVLVTVLGWDSNFTVLLTIGIAVSFLILHARLQPMKNEFEQGLQMFSLVAIFINVLLAALKIPVNHSVALSIVLTLLNVAVISIIVGKAFVGLLIHLRRFRTSPLRSDELSG